MVRCNRKFIINFYMMETQGIEQVLRKFNKHYLRLCDDTTYLKKRQKERVIWKHPLNWKNHQTNIVLRNLHQKTINQERPSAGEHDLKIYLLPQIAQIVHMADHELI